MYYIGVYSICTVYILNIHIMKCSDRGENKGENLQKLSPPRNRQENGQKWLESTFAEP